MSWGQYVEGGGAGVVLGGLFHCSVLDASVITVGWG